MNKIELLAPAGDLGKLKTAVDYGADAVYFGGELFSLRAGAGNLSIRDMKTGVAYAHEHGVKAYLALNIIAHNEDLEPLLGYIKSVRNIPIDAFIVTDPAVIISIKRIIPDAELHLSTQANTTNYITAGFWHDMGIKRIVMARELSLNEIIDIRKAISDDMEIETFAHGAMCISYSGRCLLSNFMVDRDANRGACAHPCRYKYRLEEEKRPGDYWPVEEDDRGTYIFNSKDLCMLEHLPDLIHAGVASVKIEGRMKSVFYVAHVVQAYRKAIDAYYENPKDYSFNPVWFEEMCKASHREFTTGFYYKKTNGEDQNYLTSAYSREYSFVGLVLDYDKESALATVEQRNKMVTGDRIEIFGPHIDFFEQKIDFMIDEEGNPIDSAPHPQQIIKIRVNNPVKAGYMLRKENK